MTDDFVSREVCEERRCTLDERFARDKTAIGNLEESMATLTKLVTELATIQRTNTQTQAEHEQRIRTLELRPAGKWDKLITGVIGAVAGGVGTMLFNNLINS